MPESKKCSIKSVALAVTTQKQSTSQTVQKQWSKQMQSTIKTPEEAKIRRIEKKKKRKQEEIKTLGNKKTEKVLLKTKQELFKPEEKSFIFWSFKFFRTLWSYVLKHKKKSGKLYLKNI